MWERRSHIQIKKQDTENQRSVNTETTSQLAQGFLVLRFNVLPGALPFRGILGALQQNILTLLELASFNLCNTLLPILVGKKNNLFLQSKGIPSRGREKLRRQWRAWGSGRGSVCGKKEEIRLWRALHPEKAQGIYCTNQEWLIDPKIKTQLLLWIWDVG